MLVFVGVGIVCLCVLGCAHISCFVLMCGECICAGVYAIIRVGCALVCISAGVFFLLFVSMCWCDGVYATVYLPAGVYSFICVTVLSVVCVAVF